MGSSLPLHQYPSGFCASPGTPRREMAALVRGKDSSRCLLLLAAVLMVESSQLGSSRAKLNSIKSPLGGETPAQAANRSAGTYQGLAFGGSKKGKNLGQVGNHLKCALQPGEGGTSALERVAFAPFDLQAGAPRCGAHNSWAGDPRAGPRERRWLGGCWCWRAWSARRVRVLPHLYFGSPACTGDLVRFSGEGGQNGPSPNLTLQCRG